MKAVQVIIYVMQNSTAGYSNLSLVQSYTCLSSHRGAITVIMMVMFNISGRINIGKLQTKPECLMISPNGNL